MDDIPMRKATKRSVSLRRLVYGVGVNDADYMVTPTIGGVMLTCPFYSRWVNMLKRCYCESFRKTRPTYEGCYVCDDWLTFSAFRCWMSNQDWAGKDLDKDILEQGNKIYSPSRCVFVSKGLNNLLISRSRSRGVLMLGVHSSHGRYRSGAMSSGGRVRLGHFDTEVEAHNAYCEFKYKVIAEAAALELEPIKSALLRYKIPKY